MEIFQKFVINISFTLATAFVAYEISKGTEFSAGDYVLFTTYMMQLFGPFDDFSWMYRSLKKAIIDMKKVFEFLEDEVEVREG